MKNISIHSISSLFLNQPKISLLEYLNFEEKAEEKHEYHGGRIRPVSSKTIRHCRIGGNLVGVVGRELIKRGEDYHVFPSILKVGNVNTASVVYPDLTITDGDVEFFTPESTYVISNPVVLFEVISPSTKEYDYSDKFNIYKTFPSFKQYVLIEQEYCHIEVRTLENVEKSIWTSRTYEDIDAVIDLTPINISLPVRDIYRRVKFEK